MPKTNKDLRDSSANGILAEPAGTIDVIIVGDSEAYCTFIPLEMWNDYGITSMSAERRSKRLTIPRIS